MGKSGRALREAKKQTRYTFTREQLEARDNLILEEKKSEIDKHIDKVWKEREELFTTSDGMDNYFEIERHMFAMASVVLIEKFGWKVSNRHDSKLKRFGEYMIDEVCKIEDDATIVNVRDYVNKVFDKYGITYERNN